MKIVTSHGGGGGGGSAGVTKWHIMEGGLKLAKKVSHIIFIGPFIHVTMCNHPKKSIYNCCFISHLKQGLFYEK
jgi:hypothetical protein